MRPSKVFRRKENQNTFSSTSNRHVSNGGNSLSGTCNQVRILVAVLIGSWRISGGENGAMGAQDLFLGR